MLLGTGRWTCFPVPLFFAISGFVLTHAVQKCEFRPFLVGRLLRLYPGFWLATFLFAIAITVTGWPDSAPFGLRLKVVGWTLRPGAAGTRYYLLGIEWSLVFELTLSLSLAGMSLLGTRRGLPLATMVWLLALGAKIAFWPGYAMEPLPSWGTFFLSAFNVPFLLGILTYYVRDRGHSRRWLVLAGLVAYLAVVPRQVETLEGLWCIYGIGAAITTWLAVQFRQLAATNPLVVAGEYSYGLYLVHVPVIRGTFAILLANGWLLDSTAGILLAGSLALIVGLVFGRIEVALHRRLRPLAKVRLKSFARLFSRRGVKPAART